MIPLVALQSAAMLVLDLQERRKRRISLQINIVGLAVVVGGEGREWTNTIAWPDLEAYVNDGKLSLAIESRVAECVKELEAKGS